MTLIAAAAGVDRAPLTDTLTESFCERCGTRYEFNAPTRLNPLRKTRGFVGGLRNYLTGQDALSDAMSDAMRTEEDGLASAQLDAFHESFNFCITCRQYTCVNCWNDGAGRCRTCAPIPGTDDLAERLAASFAAPIVGTQPGMVQDAHPGHLELDVWPMSDLPIDSIGGNGKGAEGWPEAEFSNEEAIGQTAWPEVEPEPVVAEVEVEPEPVVAEVESEPVVAEVEPELEPVVVEVEVEPEPEPVVVEVEPEPVVAEVEPEPEPVVAEVEPEPEPVVAEVEPEPEPEPVVAEVEPEPEPEPIAAGIEIEPVHQPLRVVAWDEDAAFELVEPELVAAEFEPFVVEWDTQPVPAADEPVVAEVEPEPVVSHVEPEPVVSHVEPEPVVAHVEPEPVVAKVEPEPVVAEVEPEPVVAEVEPEPEPPRLSVPPIRDTILPFPTRRAPAPAHDERVAAAAEANSPEVAARRAQLDDLGLGGPDSGAAEGEMPQPLPYRSRGAAVTQADLARAEVLRRSFWEASAREVASAGAQVGVQSCGQCGLSLSANARFCRRCGTSQAQSA